MGNNKIFKTQDGSHSIFSETYGVSYHSKYGAIQETQHVFIDAAFKYKAIGGKTLSILDIGFGTGLNAYMTLLEAIKRKMIISYSAIELFPLNYDEAERLNYPDILKDKNDPKGHLFLSLHQLSWNVKKEITAGFTLHKMRIPVQEFSIPNQFDIIYFDVFDPVTQPELWDTELIGKMYNALKTEGILVTYSAKGSVKRTLKEIGFQVESLKGPPGKREMTRAIKPQK
ncbi:MAG: tRNA (5-methylaminomethyl-2-thiouridine)(34)-methyltransferase MnmD [Bacteroidetes bacterium]|nr:tRNA (5-methylaminomethyl-2-thiouridine)(34)-methyltransferase MnmD [Bacteroidota bacterium]